MANQAAKAKMPTSAAGSKQTPGSRRVYPLVEGLAAPGFSLIELMIVVALIAMATAGAVLSLRDSTSSALERDAQRLAAVLEAARAQARANDVAVVWQAQSDGFVLRGLHKREAVQPWLSQDTRSRSAAAVVLGPEPLLPPQRIELYSASQLQQRLWVVSDGLRPFTVQSMAEKSAP